MAEDRLKEVADELLNRKEDFFRESVVEPAAKLAKEELWRRHGGPAPWDEEAEEMAKKPVQGALNRAMTDEEAGIAVPPLSDEAQSKFEASQEALRQSKWEKSSD
jgi:hypothetical protein